jgi:hypothetical protein
MKKADNPMKISDQVNAIQSYLRENARRQYESVSLPPFSLFFHPTDPVIYFNYAIPDSPIGGDQQNTLTQLCIEFRQRGRLPRFEFLYEYAPDLPLALLAGGFDETERQWNMICTPSQLQQAPPVPDLTLIELNPESPTADIRDYIMAQRQGFDPANTVIPAEADIRQARLDLLIGGWQAYLARVGAEPAGAAAFGRIITGISEIAGIATRMPFRRRGIATYLTWLTAWGAFHRGAHTTCLTAADAAAGRIYERVGFKPLATMLSFAKPNPYDHPNAP